MHRYTLPRRLCPTNNVLPAAWWNHGKTTVFQGVYVQKARQQPQARYALGNFQHSSNLFYMQPLLNLEHYISCTDTLSLGVYVLQTMFCLQHDGTMGKQRSAKVFMYKRHVSSLKQDTPSAQSFSINPALPHDEETMIHAAVLCSYFAALSIHLVANKQMESAHLPKIGASNPVVCLTKPSNLSSSQAYPGDIRSNIQGPPGEHTSQWHFFHLSEKAWHLEELDWGHKFMVGKGAFDWNWWL